MKPSNSIQDNSVDATRIAQSSFADSDATRIVRDAHLKDLATDDTRIFRRDQATSPSTKTKQDAPERYQIGDKISGRYEVLAIHRGTMGIVYGTFDHIKKLPRALKTLQQRHTVDSKMRDLFVAEALTWVKLEKHPFIVRAYLVERFDAQPYVITEYIRGQENMGGDLRAWLGHPKLTLPIAVEMALQIAQGMQHAVRKVPGLLHRDLKPANILVNDRVRAMVTDFGLAQAEDTGAGTPAYMAPEQWRSATLDVRTDIYAFGCILYEMFTGHRMYAAHSEGEWETAHLTQMPMTPTALNPSLPPQISDFIVHCLAKQRAHRPADWDEVVMECAHWFHEITGLPVVFDFSGDALSANELISASYSLGELEKYPEMLEVCDRALALVPNYAAAWNNKGHALTELRRHEEGLAAYDRALTLVPNFVVAWYNKADTLNRLRRHEEAIAACDQALAHDANVQGAWTNKGDALRELKRYEEALAAFVRALALDVNNASAWYNKGTALKSLKRYDEAISAFDRALAIDPSYSGASNNKGNALKDLNRLEEALTAYDRALALDPNYANAWHNKSIALQLLIRYEEALSASDHALAIDQNYADYWYNKGNVLFRLKRYKEAISAYDSALAINISDAGYWYNKGVALRELKRYEESLVASERALAINPSLDSAQKNKEFVLQELKRENESSMRKLQFIWTRFWGK
jgi:tetratricopeptide (TPR) repeat protein